MIINIQRYSDVIRRFLYAVFAVMVLQIAVVSCSDGQQSTSHNQTENTPTEQTINLPTEIKQFIETTAPELLDRLRLLANLLQDIENKIHQLSVLLSYFPQHSEIIKPRLNKWKHAEKQLIGTQDQIHHQIERAFVIYEVNQGVHEFEETAKTLMQKADEAFKIAESLTKIEAELQQPTGQ